MASLPEEAFESLELTPEPMDHVDSAPIIYDRKPADVTPSSPFRPLSGEPMTRDDSTRGATESQAIPTEPMRRDDSRGIRAREQSRGIAHTVRRAESRAELNADRSQRAERAVPASTSPFDDRSSPWSNADLDAAATLPPQHNRSRNSPVARAQAVIVDDDDLEIRVTAERPVEDVTVKRDIGPAHISPFSSSPFDDDDEPAPPPRAQQPRRRTTTSAVIRREDLARSVAPMNLPDTPWADGLAARIDAALTDDDFGGETPVIAPTKEELEALLGRPEPTRQVPFEEIEALRHASEDEPSEPELEILRPRKPLTEEVLPEDIEAAIEIAPPARRAPNIIAVAKKKKPE